MLQTILIQNMPTDYYTRFHVVVKICTYFCCHIVPTVFIIITFHGREQSQERSGRKLHVYRILFGLQEKIFLKSERKSAGFALGSSIFHFFTVWGYVVKESTEIGTDT